MYICMYMYVHVCMSVCMNVLVLVLVSENSSSTSLLIIIFRNFRLPCLKCQYIGIVYDSRISVISRFLGLCICCFP